MKPGHFIGPTKVTEFGDLILQSVEQFAFAELRAPFGGIVTALKAEPGQVVQPGETIATMARPDVQEAVIDLPEGFGQDLGPKARFDVTLQLDPSVRAVGVVRETAPQADRARTRRVKITLVDPPEGFRLGTTITATLAMQAAPTVQLPIAAVVEQQGRTRVWVVDPATGTVSPQDVTLGSRDGKLGEASNGSMLQTVQPGTTTMDINPQWITLAFACNAMIAAIAGLFELMLNPLEQDHHKLGALMKQAIDQLRSSLPEGGLEQKIEVISRDIMHVSLGILRREWRRVKRGE